VSGWGIAWLARRPAWSDAGRAALPLVSCAMIIGLLAIEIESRVSGDRLAVVGQSEYLTVDPAIGMDRGPTVGAGEIVRVVGRRGTWARVEASDDRDGWVPSSALLFITERRPPLN
jgi:hypothetical protein